MEKECAWCGLEFEDEDEILEYQHQYFCDEECLISNLAIVRRITFYKEVD